MVVLWFGPVSPATLEKAPWQGEVRVVTYNHGPNGPQSIGSTAFEQLAQAHAAAAGSPLRGALKAKGLDPDTAEPIAVAAFSAGWGWVEHALRNEDDRRRIVAVGAFDAYYTGPSKSAKPGYRAYAELAAAGERRMVLTSSHIAGPSYPSSAAAVEALLEPLGLGPINLRSVPPAECELAAGRGGLRWYVYRNRTDANLDAGARLRKSHVQHATVLAPAMMPELVSGQLPAAGDPGGSAAELLALLLALGLLFADELGIG